MRPLPPRLVAGLLIAVSLALGVSLLAQNTVTTVPKITGIVDPANLTGSITTTVNGIGATDTDGLVLRNTTPATVGATVQRAPGLHWIGNAWDTDDAVSRNTDCYVKLQPVSSATVSAQLTLDCQLVTFGYSQPWRVNTAGQQTLLGGSIIGVSSGYSWTGRSNMESTADGTINFSKNANSLIGLDALSFGRDVIVNGSAVTYASGCGAGSPIPVGNASAFAITIGAGGDTACAVTFTTPFTNTPHCVANNRTSAQLARVSLPATTGATIAGTLAAGDVIDVICQGHWQ